MSFTQVGPLTIHYQTAGKGVPLVLLHGLGNNSQSWSHQLNGLKDHCQVIAWDTPGYGQSSDPEPEFRTFRELAEMLKGFLDSLGLQKIHLLGHSMGSTLAMQFCSMYPEYVEALILASSTRGGMANLETNDRKLKNRLQTIETLSPQELAEQRVPDMLSAYASDEVIAEATRIMAQVRPAGYRSVAYSLHQADQTVLLSSITVPTLILCGEDDIVTPVAESRSVEQGIAGSKLAVIGQAGHLCYMEKPDEFNAHLLSFLHRLAMGAKKHPAGTRMGLAMEEKSRQSATKKEEAR